MTYIGLLDCNNFFVSCERLFRPDLMGRPTAVLSSNDGCVVARSEEVKALDVPMGIPHFKVRDIFKQHNVTIFSGNITLYRDISARVMHILRECSDDVEQYSIDESFFRINAESDEDVYGEIKMIQERIEHEIGIPVSIGAGKSKTIAKFASEREKRKSGLCVLAGPSWQQLAAEIPIGAIWGVGGKTEQKMRALGITTVQAFLDLDPARIDALFGIFGTRLYAELSEVAGSSLALRESQKSIMSTRSFKDATHDLVVLKDAVAYHVGYVAESLRKKGLVAQTLRVSMRPSRHGAWLLRAVDEDVMLPEPSNDTRVLLHAAMRVVETKYDGEVPYKKVGVIAQMLRDAEGMQTTLFRADEAGNTSDAVMQTLDVLNERFGKGTVTLGRYKKDGMWNPRSAHVSPKYTTKWSDIMSVRA